MTITANFIAQSASIIVYAVTIIASVFAYIETYSLAPRSIEQMSARVLLSLTIVMSCAFVFNQSMYIANNSFSDVPFAEVIGWLLFDWANGLTHLSFALATRIAIVQRAMCPCQKSRAKRAEHHIDYEQERLFSASTHLEQLNAELQHRRHTGDI
jgi:hypothetical protein